MFALISHFEYKFVRCQINCTTKINIYVVTVARGMSVRLVTLPSPVRREITKYSGVESKKKKRASVRRGFRFRVIANTAVRSEDGINRK